MTDDGVVAARPIHGAAEVQPVYQPLDTDSIPEFHAARLLLLLWTCGSGSPRRISGRTKLAKLDFFLRYPSFLERALAATGNAAAGRDLDRNPEPEAPMIRYRYGPWDPRYRSFLALLESRGLVQISGTRVDQIALTTSGGRLARQLAERSEFSGLGQRGRVLGAAFGAWTGTSLKDLIYELFPEQVGERAMGERIQP